MKENWVDIIRLFVQKGVDDNAKTSGGWTALHSVCYFYKQRNLIEIIRLFIGNGVEVHAKINGGHSALALLRNNYKKGNLDAEVEKLLS